MKTKEKKNILYYGINLETGVIEQYQEELAALAPQYDLVHFHFSPVRKQEEKEQIYLQLAQYLKTIGKETEKTCGETFDQAILCFPCQIRTKGEANFQKIKLPNQNSKKKSTDA